MPACTQHYGRPPSPSGWSPTSGTSRRRRVQPIGLMWHPGPHETIVGPAARM